MVYQPKPSINNDIDERGGFVTAALAADQAAPPNTALCAAPARPGRPDPPCHRPGGGPDTTVLAADGTSRQRIESARGGQEGGHQYMW